MITTQHFDRFDSSFVCDFDFRFRFFFQFLFQTKTETCNLFFVITTIIIIFIIVFFLYFLFVWFNSASHIKRNAHMLYVCLFVCEGFFCILFVCLEKKVSWNVFTLFSLFVFQRYSSSNIILYSIIWQWKEKKKSM